MSGAAPDFAAELMAERRVAARTLMESPLVTAESHSEEFQLIRRHADELTRQFGQIFGYQLVVESGFARLYKAGLGRDAGHWLRRGKTDSPFTPRAYAYLALALSVLVTAPEQLLLSELITRTRAAAAEAGITLAEATRQAERRALVAALKQLESWRVLTEDEGSVESYAGDEAAEALLTIDREIARRLVGSQISRARSPEELIETAAQADLGPRHYVRRRLADTPVVYLDDLTVTERGWLRQQQRREERVFEEFLGLHAEIRAEGVAMFDPEGRFDGFPGTGTLHQAALLLIEWLVALARPEGAGHRAAGGTLVIGVPIPGDLIDEILAELVERHRKHWSEQLLSSPAAFRSAVLDLLKRMRLIAPAGAVRAPGDEIDDTGKVTDVRGARGDATTGWVLLAAAARYAPMEERQ